MSATTWLVALPDGVTPTKGRPEQAIIDRIIADRLKVLVKLFRFMKMLTSTSAF
jgi:hypothetical protein